MKRTIAGGLTLAMLLALQGAALAEEPDRDGDRPADEPAVIVDRVTDRPTDVVRDRPTDKVTDRPTDRVRDRKTDVRPDVVRDRPTDRPITDRCHLVTNDHVRRICKTDKPTDVNIRHLIHRLVHAGEWVKLIRLLHRLGWI